jgi:hypothetical protein
VLSRAGWHQPGNVTCDTVTERFRGSFTGSWGIVSLPGSQQQVLDRIEADIEDCEPRLKSMFAIFTRLTRDDGEPRTEALLSRSPLAGQVRAIIAAPLILGLVALLVFMAITGSTARSCQPATGTPSAARTESCQSSQQPLGRP